MTTTFAQTLTDYADGIHDHPHGFDDDIKGSDRAAFERLLRDTAAALLGSPETPGRAIECLDDAVFGDLPDKAVRRAYETVANLAREHDFSTPDALSPDEYETLVRLTEKATRLTQERLPAYRKATGEYLPGRGESFDSIEFKSASPDRPGRDPLGRYDIVLTFRDYERDRTDFALPSAILWDPEGITAAVVAKIEAQRAEAVRAESERAAQYRAEAEKTELARAKATLRKHGYKAVRKR